MTVSIEIDPIFRTPKGASTLGSPNVAGQPLEVAQRLGKQAAEERTESTETLEQEVQRLRKEKAIVEKAARYSSSKIRGTTLPGA